MTGFNTSPPYWFPLTPRPHRHTRSGTWSRSQHLVSLTCVRVMSVRCSVSSSASTNRMIELYQFFSFFLFLITLPELIHSVEVLLGSFHTGSQPQTKVDNPWAQPATSDHNQRLLKQDTSLQGLNVFILMGFFFSLCFAFSSPGSVTPSPLSGSDGIFVGFVWGPPWDYP